MTSQTRLNSHSISTSAINIARTFLIIVTNIEKIIICNFQYFRMLRLFLLTEYSEESKYWLIFKSIVMMSLSWVLNCCAFVMRFMNNLMTDDVEFQIQSCNKAFSYKQ